MKSILTGLLAVSLLGGANVPANDFKALFAKHWQISKEFTLAVAEAMPGEFYNFKPNPEEMSFGELMSHIAQSNSEAFANVADIEPLPVPAGYDKRTVIKFLNDSFDWCARPSRTPRTTGARRRCTCGSRTSSRLDMSSDVAWASVPSDD